MDLSGAHGGPACNSQVGMPRHAREVAPVDTFAWLLHWAKPGASTAAIAKGKGALEGLAALADRRWRGEATQISY